MSIIHGDGSLQAEPKGQVCSLAYMLFICLRAIGDSSNYNLAYSNYYNVTYELTAWRLESAPALTLINLNATIQ